MREVGKTRLNRQQQNYSYLFLMQTHPDAAQLKELQDSIFREKVLRARSMTEDERFASALELIDFAYEQMLAGVQMEFPDISQDEALKILGKRLDRLRAMEDYGLYVPAPPLT